MKTATRYRFNRIGEVVVDTRRMTPAYLNPAVEKYETGQPIFVPKSSSPARQAHPSRGPEVAALRVAAKKAAETATKSARLAAIHAVANSTTSRQDGAA